MNKTLLTLSVAIGVAIAGMAQAAEVIPVNFDGPGEGYNDPTAAAPVAGNPGTTVGGTYNGGFQEVERPVIEGTEKGEDESNR